MTRNQNKAILVISVILLILALLLHIAQLWMEKDILLMAATVTSGFPIAKRAWQSTRMKTFSIELLVIIAVVGALLIREYLESAIVTFLFLFGAYLEVRTLEKTRSSLKSLMDLSPREATILREGHRITIPADEVVKGDHVLIQSGEKVAIDGRVISGEAFINEAAITGESLPVRKAQTDPVFSGTLLDHGYIEVIAEKVGEDTTFSKIIEMVEEAQETKAKTQKYLEKFANLYTPAILLLAIIVFTLTRDIRMSLTFLVIACPGALVISAPVSIVAGIGNGAKKGVLIKGGDIMERLSSVDTIVFDKTGTLTKGQPEVVDVQTYGIDKNVLLQMAAEAEVISEHPLGQTIITKAQEMELKLVNTPSDFEIAKGYGIKATVNESHLILGNKKWLIKNAVKMDQTFLNYAQEQEERGFTTIFIALDSSLAGIISIADQIRPEIKDTLFKLKNYGIKRLIMLTGDNPTTAVKIAQQLGIVEVFAGLLPKEKQQKIKEMKDLGYHVAMVGDGINDAPAIATADIGMAMGGVGTDVAMDTADVVFMADQLGQLPHAIQLSKMTIKNMKQNMFIAISTVVFLLAGVLTRNIFLASGMFIHEISVLIVILNAIRLVNYNNRKRRKMLKVPAADHLL